MSSGRLALALACVAAVAGGRAGAVDLTGTWRVEYQDLRTEFIDIAHSSGTVSMTLEPSPGFPVSLTGPYDPVTNLLSMQVPGCLPPSCYGGLPAYVLPGGNWFVGRLVIGAPPLPGTERILASRCECFDGNAAGGDGCDEQCRVEPCFTCSGMPSVCAPTPDGGACDDRADCTSGETCGAGVCGGGVAVPGCFDVSGLWDVHNQQTGGFASDNIADVEQRDGEVLFRYPPTGAAGWLGTIDRASGALTLRTPRMFILCSGFDQLTGSLAAGGQSFSLAGPGSINTIRGCFDVDLTATGTRRTCGDGNLDPGEQCDDGNLVSGDGCDANCAPSDCGNGVVAGGEECDDGNTAGGDGCSAACFVESCPNGVLDVGEQCDDGNIVSGDGCDVTCRPTGCGSGFVTTGEQCDDGNTSAGDGCSAACTTEPCWSCTGWPSGCVPWRMATCARPRDPRRAALQVRNSSGAGHDALAVRSGETEGLAAAALGDPRTTTDYQVCLFDRSDPFAARPLFAARVPAGGTCGSEPCWRAVPGGFAYRNRDAAPHGIGKLLVVGDDGSGGRVMAVGRGAGLGAAPTGVPALPLPVPLELQVQTVGTGAGCVAMDFPADGVTHNDAARGRFQARGAP